MARRRRTVTVRVKLIVPTAINLLTAANAAFVSQNAKNETLGVDIPSLRRRATLVVKEKGVLPIQDSLEEDNSLTR